MTRTASPKKRTLKVLLASPERLLVEIVEDGRPTATYHVVPMADGVARWSKFLEQGGEVYVVSATSCDCAGHRRWGAKGTVCRHRAATKRLIEQGRLPH